MTRFSLGVLAALSTSMLLVGVATRADEPTLVTASTETPTPVIDPTAKKFLADIGLAYENLDAFACHYSVKQDYKGAPVTVLSGDIALRRPDHLAVVAEMTGNPGPPTRCGVVANGKSYIVWDAEDAKHYYKPPKPLSLDAVWSDAGMGGSPTAALFLQQGSKAGDLLANMPNVKLTVSDGEVIDGLVTKVLTISSDLIRKNVHIVRTTVLTVGESDHLIRRASKDTYFVDPTSTQPIRHNTRVDEYTNVKTGSDVSDAPFTQKPPAGLKLGSAAARAARIAEASVPYNPKLIVGAKPYAFSTKDLKQAPVSLAAYKGKVVLLDFWASWCGPCDAEMPNVKSVYDKYHPLGLEIVGVSLDLDCASAEDYVSRREISWRQIWDNDIVKKYKVRAIPLALLIGKDGKIAAVNAQGEELGQAVAKALAAK